MPLLTNVVNWLAPPAGRADKGRIMEAMLRLVVESARALDVALRYQLRILPREALVEAMNGLVANAAGDPWTEEAYWIAAQSINDGSLLPHRRARVHQSAGWTASPTPKPDPAFYQKLADRDPTGDLAPYARWWVAECLRRGNLVASSGGQEDAERRTPRPVREGEGSSQHQGVGMGGVEAGMDPLRRGPELPRP